MMIATSRHEAEVGARFDLLESRFKREIDAEDVRLRALQQALAPLDGLRVLDLGCGKGRFARRLADAGASVVGIDLSAAMLAAAGFDRVRASARRLPLADETFDAVVAVEVLEHVAALDAVLAEARRVLRPGGVFAVIDKNAGALNAERPWLPALAVKAIDERRGRWMYPHGGPVRERWFWPGTFARGLCRAGFGAITVDYLLGPRERAWRVFRAVAPARLFVRWTARAPGRAS